MGATYDEGAEPLLDKAGLALERSGVKPEKIQGQTITLLHREDLIDEILKAGKQNRCDTVAVGRNAFPWVREILLDHVGEKLAENAEALAIRVVE